MRGVTLRNVGVRCALRWRRLCTLILRGILRAQRSGNAKHAGECQGERGGERCAAHTPDFTGNHSACRAQKDFASWNAQLGPLLAKLFGGEDAGGHGDDRKLAGVGGLHIGRSVSDAADAGIGA